jgi:hypothetical protein
MKTRVDDEIKAGRLWRARERLSGVLQHRIYDPDLCEEMGYVLLLMNDLPEAGKYLFLSGKRKPEYEEAIEIFLQRHGRHGWKQLASQFPKRLQNLRLDQFPQSVQDQLHMQGMPPESGEMLPDFARPATTRQKIISVFATIGCYTFALAVAFIFFKGLEAILSSR